MKKYISGYIFIQNSVIILFLFCFIGLMGCRPSYQKPNSRSAYLQAVQKFADNVLEHGRDRYGEVHSPLFVDGIHVDTHEPVRWEYEGEKLIMSNMASQQNLFRTLSGLTALVGDDRYKDAAKDAIGHMFAYHSSESGLLYWGGHRFVDLETDRANGEYAAFVHEFKWHFPFYELMWEVDPWKTTQFFRALWNASIVNWSTLEFTRHAPFEKPMGSLWSSEFGHPPPFSEGGLTFINAGSDLIYAAGEFSALSGEREPLLWGLRLAKMYVDARHPETQLGVYKYTRRFRHPDSPDDPDYLLTKNDWWSGYEKYGDLAQRQFGPEFGEIAVQGKLLDGDRGIYTRNAIMQLQLAERLGEEGAELLEWTRAGMRAYVEYAYIPERNTLRPMWIDGTYLTGFVIPRPGYFGRKGRVFRERTANMVFFHSYSLAYKLTQDDVLWSLVRGVARGHGLGEVGEKPGVDVDLNFSTKNADPVAIFALLDLYRAVGHDDYLELARRIGDNIIRDHFHHGFFLPSEKHINARFDTEEPLALLALEAVLRGTPDAVPDFNGGRGFLQAQFDGMGRTFDRTAIWEQTRK